MAEIMRRYQNNPILEAIGTHAWESRLVFNAAAFAAKGRVLGYEQKLENQKVQ